MEGALAIAKDFHYPGILLDPSQEGPNPVKTSQASSLFELTFDLCSRIPDVFHRSCIESACVVLVHKIAQSPECRIERSWRPHISGRSHDELVTKRLGVTRYYNISLPWIFLRVAVRLWPLGFLQGRLTASDCSTTYLKLMKSCRMAKMAYLMTG